MSFIPLENLNALSDGYKKAFKVNNLHLLLIQHQGERILIENKCPHMDIALDTGKVLDDGAIRCRAHGIEFDLKTGCARGPLAGSLDTLKRFTLVFEGNKVGVDL